MLSGMMTTADSLTVVDNRCWQRFVARNSVLCTQLGWSSSSWHGFTQQFISKVMYCYIALQIIVLWCVCVYQFQYT